MGYDTEKYRRQIEALPAELQHTLAEADPETAAAWAAREEALADTWAREHRIHPDPAKAQRLFLRIRIKLGPPVSAPKK